MCTISQSSSFLEILVRTPPTLCIALNLSRSVKVHQRIGATGLGYKLSGNAFALPLARWGETEDYN